MLVLNRSEAFVSIRLGNITDCGAGTSSTSGGVAAPRATEDWILSIGRGERHVTFEAEGRALVKQQPQRWPPPAPVALTRATRRTLYLRARSITGLYDRGVAQMMVNTDQHEALIPTGDSTLCMVSDQPLPRAFAVGGGVALDVLRGAHGTFFLIASSQCQQRGSHLRRLNRLTLLALTARDF